MAIVGYLLLPLENVPFSACIVVASTDNMSGPDALVANPRFSLLSNHQRVFSRSIYGIQAHEANCAQVAHESELDLQPAVEELEYSARDLRN